jgi:hypothetical protein
MLLLQMRRHLYTAAWGAIVLSGTQPACRRGFREGAEGVDVARPSAIQEPPDVALRGVAFARLSAGRVVSRGTAATAAWNKTTGKLEATTLDARVARGSQAPDELGELTLRAPSAAGEPGAKVGAAWGGVQALAARGDRAATERLDAENGEIRAPGPVTASGPGYRVQGNALTARADGERVELRGGVKGRLSSDGGRK